MTTKRKSKKAAPPTKGVDVFLLMLVEGTIEVNHHTADVILNNFVVHTEPTGLMDVTAKNAVASFHALHMTEKELKDVIDMAIRKEDRLLPKMFSGLSITQINYLLNQAKRIDENKQV